MEHLVPGMANKQSGLTVSDVYILQNRELESKRLSVFRFHDFERTYWICANDPVTLNKANRTGHFSRDR